MKNLLIDDMRTFTVDKTCRTFDEGVTALKEGGITVLYLDHDLGAGAGKEGRDIAKLIESGEVPKPGRVVLVSDNVVGRADMAAALKHVYNSWNWNEREFWNEVENENHQ